MLATINISNAVDSMILISGKELNGSSKAIGSQCVGLSVCSLCHPKRLSLMSRNKIIDNEYKLGVCLPQNCHV